jgi:hypothetical protein
VTPKVETIPAPKEPGKKMPDGKSGKEVRTTPPPIAPPALEVTPVTTPRAFGQN